MLKKHENKLEGPMIPDLNTAYKSTEIKGIRY